MYVHLINPNIQFIFIISHQHLIKKLIDLIQPDPVSNLIQ